VTLSWTDDRCSGTVHLEGDLAIADDGTDIVRLSPGGVFTIEERVEQSGRRIEIRADAAGTLTRQWIVNGTAEPYGAEARRWLTDALATLARHGGLQYLTPRSQWRAQRMLSAPRPVALDNATQRRLLLKRDRVHARPLALGQRAAQMDSARRALDTLYTRLSWDSQVVARQGELRRMQARIQALNVMQQATRADSAGAARRPRLRTNALRFDAHRLTPTQEREEWARSQMLWQQRSRPVQHPPLPIITPKLSPRPFDSVWIQRNRSLVRPPTLGGRQILIWQQDQGQRRNRGRSLAAQADSLREIARQQEQLQQELQKLQATRQRLERQQRLQWMLPDSGGR
jgi:hypothetical protein